MANNINDIIYPDLGGFDSTTVKYSFSLSDSGWNGQDAVNGDYYFDDDYKAAFSGSEQVVFSTALQSWD